LVFGWQLKELGEFACDSPVEGAEFFASVPNQGVGLFFEDFLAYFGWTWDEEFLVHFFLLRDTSRLELRIGTVRIGFIYPFCVFFLAHKQMCLNKKHKSHLFADRKKTGSCAAAQSSRRRMLIL